MLVAQALLGLTANLVEQANCLPLSENALAHSMLACWRNWLLGKNSGLFSQTVLVFQGLLAYELLLAAVPQGEAMLTKEEAQELYKLRPATRLITCANHGNKLICP